MPIGKDNDANGRMILNDTEARIDRANLLSYKKCEEKAESYSAEGGSRHEFQARLRLHIVKSAS